MAASTQVVLFSQRRRLMEVFFSITYNLDSSVHTKGFGSLR